ncbi:polysaccharide biosynthesis tyrosine autokinase [Dyella flava]|uniref:Polysaccharide biosynthesis tyrosine autokinase n=1 Tax=Dyella flava TaxID=1920170 RepID=A0ABS2K1E1_9GAMM|nr:polysaccharide biosynthesis tyrosine autokinase [Dyella flava]MBM7125057.1 polysaccharide biosynthesis tyrosine autokinase [Dyella flava]GLQ51929.1 protein-tyrosine kinase [Dyella flava]
MTTKQSFSMHDDDIDLRALFGTVADHKWLIVGITFVFLIISILYSLIATPVYQASASVQVEQKTPTLPGLNDLTDTLGISNSEAVTEIQVLGSRAIIGPAVENLNMDIESTPKHFPVVGGFLSRWFTQQNPGTVAPPLIPGLERYDWGGSELSISVLKVPAGLLDEKLQLVAGEHGTYTLQDMDGNPLLSGQAGKSVTGNGVTILVSTLRGNPGTRFQVIRRTHMDTIAQLQKDIQISELGKDSGIIQLTYNNKDPVLATQLLDQVTGLYVHQNVERSAAEAANSLKFVQQELPRVKQELEHASQALNTFQLHTHTADLSMQTQSMLDEGVSIDSNLQQLRMQMSDVEHRFTPEHPEYRTLQQQIGQLESEKGALQAQIGHLPNTQQQLLKLTRDVTVSDQTYTSLLNQEQQLDIARAGSIGNVRVIDHPAVNLAKPWWPRPIWVIPGGMVLGVIFALGFIFLRQLLSRGVEDPEAIERLGLPVYVSIPLSDMQRKSSVGLRHHFSSRGRQRLLALNAPGDMATEALRSLRTSLHFAQLGGKNNVLMISSPSPEAGKSFVAANLAVVMAQAGQRVLLIDADMRKGLLHKAIGVDAEDGLSEAIAGETDSIIQTIRAVDGMSELFFMPRGNIPPNPSELLMHSNFGTLLEILKPQFDLIIIDTPPILAVTDAAVIGHYVGTSLMVVRFGISQGREIALAKQRLEQSGVLLKGAIFNLVEKRSAGYYAYAYTAYAPTEV